MANSKYNYSKAVGLHYDSADGSAPQMGVKGEAYKADEIVRLAKRFGVPVVENPSLVKALSMLEFDEQIPEELFEAVAILLSQVEEVA